MGSPVWLSRSNVTVLIQSQPCAGGWGLSKRGHILSGTSVTRPMLVNNLAAVCDLLEVTTWLGAPGFAVQEQV